MVQIICPTLIPTRRQTPEEIAWALHNIKYGKKNEQIASTKNRCFY